jgi:hypothetical protein
MNIALSILLLVFGGLTLWLLTESTVRWYLKVACISVFCIFTVVFWLTIHSFLGWPALEDDLPDKVLIHWVVIKEPNKTTNFDGAIYFLLESAEEEGDSLIGFFGYKSDDPEPRLYGLSYSRKLHEKIEKQMMGRLRRGQPVVGRFSKMKKGAGEGEEEANRDGGGSQSQRQEWEFHYLLPSDFLEK